MNDVGLSSNRDVIMMMMIMMISFHFIQQQRTKKPLTSRDKYSAYIHTCIHITHYIYIYIYIYIRIYTRYRNTGAENIISSLSKI